MSLTSIFPRDATQSPEIDHAKVEALKELLRAEKDANRAKQMLHEDLRTNLTAFSSWLHAYLISPHRALSNKGAKRLTKLVARRKLDIMYVEEDDLTEEMRHVIGLWEQEPIEIGSTEWRRARIREIRDMHIVDAIDEEVQNGLVLSELEQGEVPQSYWRGPLDKQLNACRAEPAAPRLKELRWKGAVLLHDPRAQVIVDACSGEPQWKVAFRTHCEQAKAKNQLKLAARMEIKKSRGKAKKKAQKARKRARPQHGPAASVEALSVRSETAGRSPSAPLMAADIVGRVEDDEELGPMEPDFGATDDDVPNVDEASAENEVSYNEEDPGLSSEASYDENSTQNSIDNDDFESEDNQGLARKPHRQYDYQDSYDDELVGFVGERYYSTNE
ncbi:MAG: hypothetical protein Q9208_001220 [Pyrenodesmia sp. 3 TL-2023]